MNLRDLEYICSVAEHRHFGRAAEMCNVSQPTLSGQIKKVEDQLGVKIFERSNKAVHVTDVGADIIALAKEARRATTQIKSIALAAQDPFAGTLSMGLIPTIAPYLIPLFVGSLSSAFPKLSMVYQEDITERLTDALLEGALQTAILATPPETDALTAIPLYKEPFWVIYPEGHDLEGRKNIAMEHIDAHDVLLLNEGHCFRDQALSLCSAPANIAGQSLRATSLETLINLVSAGQGVTLVPSLTLHNGLDNRHGIKSAKVTDKNAKRVISLVYRKRFPREKVAHALADHIKANLPDWISVF